jgi:hypothetical protein
MAIHIYFVPYLEIIFYRHQENICNKNSNQQKRLPVASKAVGGGAEKQTD